MAHHHNYYYLIRFFCCHQVTAELWRPHRDFKVQRWFATACLHIMTYEIHNANNRKCKIVWTIKKVISSCKRIKRWCHATPRCKKNSLVILDKWMPKKTHARASIFKYVSQVNDSKTAPLMKIISDCNRKVLKSIYNRHQISLFFLSCLRDKYSF